MLTVYHKLLLLYPSEHRAHFAEEMIEVFSELRAELEKKGFLARATFFVREIAGLASGALREHLRNVFGGHAALSLYTRRFTMRDGFRFPKTTAVLMAIILAGVLVAIRKGEAIEASLPHVSQPIAPIHSAPSYLLPGVVVGFLFFYAAGLIGWVILFALRRSGVHRLDEMSAERK